MKVYLDMVGCRLNQSEIEKMAATLQTQGHEIVSEAGNADYIIVNTCCVTAKASADSRKMIRKYGRETGAKVIATGCWSTIFKHEAQELTSPELVFDNLSKETLVNYLAQTRFLTSKDKRPKTKPSLGSRSRTRSFIKIQDGCDNFCTYCLTRIARGPSKSVPAEQVIRDVLTAEEQGAKEIVLTGVQLGSWGKDLFPEVKISDLLIAVLESTQIPRVRISSIEPWSVDDALLDCWINERLCPHLHIPLQSGNDLILRRMGRPFTSDQYRKLIERISEKVPEMAITTDIIVGFPGETDEDFFESFNLIQTLGFSGGHVFRFSCMPQTAASGFENQIPAKISQSRSHHVLELFQNASIDKMKSMVGRVESVLWECNPPQSGRDHYSGFTRNYLRVDCNSAMDIHNTIRNVLITGIDQYGHLTGTLIDA
ncbi:MAG: tRNA (N(6)-L-threonylcarbamoyladenosine(37)-C(2))-methylthiotransferase MtaB [Anaerolineaceae bacterium]